MNITATNIGLGNVDNTSDANKPISNATQAALNDKQSKITANGILKGNGTGGVSAAVKGTDYFTPTDVNEIAAEAAKKVDISGKVSKSGDTMTGKLTVPQVETGDGNSNFFQCRKFRGEGDANTYYHAIDFGYQNHDKVDFHEYGGIWNFFKNTSGKANEGSLCGKITTNGWEGRAKLQSGSTMVTSQLTENSDAIATTAFVHGLVDNVKHYSASNPPPYPVTSVNNKTGAVTLTKGDVGLGNVDNTSDANKPISNATQTALNDKQSKITANGFLKGDGTGVITADKPVFYVTLKQNSSTKTYYADKTFSQILAAYDSGYEVKAIRGDSLFSLVQFNRFSNMYYFIHISNDAIYTFLGRKSSGVEEWTYSTKGLVIESRTINNKPLSSDITLTPSDINAQSKITANGILKGDGNGGVVAATRGSDYIASGNIVKQTLVATETTPTENYVINWVYG